MLVVDASALVVALLDGEADGQEVRRRLRGNRLAAPALLDLEVGSDMRGLVRGGSLREGRAREALDDLTDLPIERILHGPLMPRVWELRDTLTAYDASYVAVAEAMDATLVTGDRRLVRAPGVRCAVDVVGHPTE